MEPFGILPARCSQRMGVIVEVSDRVGVFIFHLLSYNDGQFRLILGDETGKTDVWQIVVVDVGVRIVGCDEVVNRMQCSVARHTLLQVVAAFANDTDRCWRDVPIGVNTSDPLFYYRLSGLSCGVFNLRNSHHLGDDALLGAEVTQLLCGSKESVVVRRDDEIFAACGSGLQPMLPAGIIVYGLQAFVVQDVVFQDRVPVRRS